MALTTLMKNRINDALKPINLKLDSLTAEKKEQARLIEFEANVGFGTQVYSLSPGMVEFDPGQMAQAFETHRESIEHLKDPARNHTGFDIKNNFFTSPDVEVLYLIVRCFRPRTIIEVGCGNSTMVSRQSIIDGGLATKMIAVDPSPRADITNLVDRLERVRLESLYNKGLFSSLEANDILFIDSSHEVRAANDVAHLFCRILPSLPSGVIVHIHDVFLPFEYPRELAVAYPSWGEQYLLHALLSGGGYEILWPGHYLQRVRAESQQQLPFLKEGRAQSFWIRKLPQ